jgi:DNA topoisomerase-1
MARSGTQSTVVALDAQARAVARAAGLRYVNDAQPGFTRTRRRKQFDYADARGTPIRRASDLARIRALAIPPAWTDVWICPVERGHIQATGRDARGRKQYRYHAAWSKARDDAKHARMCDFAAGLRSLRSHCDRLLRTRQHTREKVLAALVRIVDLTAIRVGHEEYTRMNDSFGLTTLRRRHARVRGSRVELRFRGKSGILRHVWFEDPALARVIASCRASHGPQLFTYRDECGRLRRIDANHVNAFLREHMGRDYSIKDFRTWAATVCVAVELGRGDPASTQRATRQQLMAAIRTAAEHLGNTPAVCRKSYVHPLIIDAHARGQVLVAGPRLVRAATGALLGYHGHEQSVRTFLLSLMRPRAATRKAS